MIDVLRPVTPVLDKKGRKTKKTIVPQKPVIYLCTPIPAFKATWQINDSVITHGVIPVIEKVAQRNGLQIIDLHTLFANDGDKMLADGIHPDAKGARRMAEIIAAELKKQK